jgi:hypothetical protein
VMSLVFLLVSVVTLLLGLRQAGLTLIFTSIGASVMAALFLAASVLRKTSGAAVEGRPREARVREWAGSEAPWRPTAPEGETRPSRAGGPLARESVVGVIDDPLAGRQQRLARERPAAGSAVARPSAGVLGPDVVVLSDRRTYHLLSCGQVRGRSPREQMKRAVAKRLGYMPCGVCTPG